MSMELELNIKLTGENALRAVKAMKKWQCDNPEDFFGWFMTAWEHGLLPTREGQTRMIPAKNTSALYVDIYRFADDEEMTSSEWLAKHERLERPIVDTSKSTDIPIDPPSVVNEETYINPRGGYDDLVLGTDYDAQYLNGSVVDRFDDDDDDE